MSGWSEEKPPSVSVEADGSVLQPGLIPEQTPFISSRVTVSRPSSRQTQAHTEACKHTGPRLSREAVCSLLGVEQESWWATW